MSEKLLITQALDERDFLSKKISDKIAGAVFLDLKRKNEETTLKTKNTPEDFAKKAESQYQQIMDLIARYDRINDAIVASNAETKIKTSFGEFTVAGAIALRNRLMNTPSCSVSFENALANKMQSDFYTMSSEAASLNARVNNTAENMRLSILGKDARQKEDKPLAVVDAYVAENTTVLADPISVGQKIVEIREKNAALISELNTQIKVSNATTYIEF